MSKDSLPWLPAGAARCGLGAAIGGGHHDLDGLIQQHPVVRKKRGQSGQAKSRLLAANL